MDLQQASDLLQLSLTIRAFFFFVVFTLAGYITWKSNHQGFTSVKVLSIILVGIGLFNLFMTYEWLLFFYL